MTTKTIFDIDVPIPIALRSGEELEKGFTINVTTQGELNKDKSNAVLVFHALTGSAKTDEWWPEIVGPGKVIDTREYFVVCANYLGSCYGTTSAAEIGGVIEIDDILRTQAIALQILGIKRVKFAIGGSVGGMLALRLAAVYPQLAEHVISIAATPLSASALALNHIQRSLLDSEGGLAAARQIATLSYKSSETLQEKYGRRPHRGGEDPRSGFDSRFDIAGYLDYQGAKFVDRFDKESYRALTKAMDLFDMSDEAIGSIKGKVSLIGISSDELFPAADVSMLASRLWSLGVDAGYYEIESDGGHDAFLSDPTATGDAIREALHLGNYQFSTGSECLLVASGI